MKKLLEWMGVAWLWIALIGSLVIAVVIVASHGGEILAFLGSAIFGFAILYVIWWVLEKLLNNKSKTVEIVKSASQPVDKQLALEKYVERKVNEQVLTCGKVGFLVYSPWLKHSLRYVFTSQIGDEDGRRREIHEKVLLHAVEYPEFQTYIDE